MNGCGGPQSDPTCHAFRWAPGKIAWALQPIQWREDFQLSCALGYPLTTIQADTLISRSKGPGGWMKFLLVLDKKTDAILGSKAAKSQAIMKSFHLVDA